MRRSATLAFFAVALLAVASAPPSRAQAEPERYSDVRLYGLSEAHLTNALAAQGVALDHVRREATARGAAVRAVLSARELAAARAAGVEVEVIAADVTAAYLAAPMGTCAEGRGASRVALDLCGTMGGYPTLDAVVALLDTLHARYPEVVSARTSLGTSVEGRDLWAVEISDRPGTDEGEPEVLYTALHHAREPGSMLAVVYFMAYLAEQYGTDARATALVDGRRLFFVPVLNPDGYAYNEAMQPAGGGMWRKNRRPHGDGETGVDLNRNYAYEWGRDNVGSSGSTWSDLYRGPAPFSEPETRALRDFVEARRFVHAFNYHTHGDLLLYSWAYAEGAYTPDDAHFRSLSDTLTAANGYAGGTSPDVLYPVNGGSDDWMYGAQENRPKIFAFTPEVGYWFWPDPIDVYRLADENLEANLLLAELAGASPVSVEPEAPRGGGPALSLAGPNPFREGTTIAFTLEVPGPARLALVDLLGREVAVLAEGAFAAGRHVVQLDGARLPAGTYALRLDAGGATTRLVTRLR